jgi:hypothetical protein
MSQTKKDDKTLSRWFTVSAEGGGVDSASDRL